MKFFARKRKEDAPILELDQVLKNPPAWFVQLRTIGPNGRELHHEFIDDEDVERFLFEQVQKERVSCSLAFVEIMLLTENGYETILSSPFLHVIQAFELAKPRLLRRG